MTELNPSMRRELRQAPDLPFELGVLAHARNYQRWIFESVEEHLGQRILEIGAGIGNMSTWLPVREWLILTEGDPALLRILENNVNNTDLRVKIQHFDVVHDPAEELVKKNVDTIVSFNVLEHIEDDVDALKKLKLILLSGNGPWPRWIVSFVPAQPWAYGGLDRALGYFRRYSHRSFRRLKNIVAPEATLWMRYFNAFSLIGWFISGKLLGKPGIGVNDVKTFERLCPYLRPLDDF